jgi:hypothetical protein
MKEQQYAALVNCFNHDALEEWVTRNTIIHDSGTDQEEHCWAPGAKLAIERLCDNLSSSGVADILMVGKRCRKCGVVKSISEFSKNLKRKDLLQSDCKECNKAARTKI